MTKWKHPTAYSFWDDSERIAIERVIDSGQFTQGREVAAFEREFSAFHGKTHGIMVNSGSSANLVAVAALFHVKQNPLKRGDKAVVPALAWSTTYAPLVQYGLDLVLMDCDDTWNADVYATGFDPQDARLVVGCSILGSPAPLEALRTAAGVLGAYFIEDNCESLGAVTAAGSRCGTVGEMSTFSFFWSHQISAIEGGMILTDNGELAKICRMLRAHGWSRDVAAPEGFDTEYDFRLFGYNVRGLELHAAIAREQLKKLQGFVSARKANAEAFRRAAAGLPVAFQEWGGDPSPFGLNFRVHDAPTRNRVVQALRAAGIDCRLPTGGSFTKHVYGQPWAAQSTPNADRLHESGLFLGNGPFDMTSQIAEAVAILKGVL